MNPRNGSFSPLQNRYADDLESELMTQLNPKCRKPKLNRWLGERVRRIETTGSQVIEIAFVDHTGKETQRTTRTYVPNDWNPPKGVFEPTAADLYGHGVQGRRWKHDELFESHELPFSGHDGGVRSVKIEKGDQFE